MDDELHVWLIEDGAWHIVIAPTEADAIALRDELHGRPDPDETIVTAATADQLDRRRWHGDDGSITSLRAEVERDFRRRYVGCSEV